MYIIANKNKRLLVKENVFLDLLATVFEEQKNSINWKNEHNFSIIWLKKRAVLLASHIMLLFPAQSINASVSLL